MRGDDRRPDAMFSYVSAEQRVPSDHPLRAVRALVDDVLRGMSREFDGLYSRIGRPSIPPERLLRAQLPCPGGRTVARTQSSVASWACWAVRALWHPA